MKIGYGFISGVFAALAVYQMMQREVGWMSLDLFMAGLYMTLAIRSDD